MLPRLVDLALSTSGYRHEFGSFIAVSVGDFISCKLCGLTRGILALIPMQIPGEVHGLVGQNVMDGDLQSFEGACISDCLTFLRADSYLSFYF